jgi:hypothetical protein
MSRECGSCSMCCKVLSIEELNKPADKWCTHCTPGKGCGIYKDRPEVCKTFKCGWLLSPEVPDWMKPSESKVLLQWDREVHGYNTVVADKFRYVVEPGTKVREFLEAVSYQLPVFVIQSKTEQFQIVDGVTTKMIQLQQPDGEGDWVTAE